MLSPRLLSILGLWIVADGIIAIVLVYPYQHYWLVIRFIRVVVGFIILVETQRIRVKLLTYTVKNLDKLYRCARIYTIVLDSIGIWLIADGLSTGLLGYTHPILVWQFIRTVRVIMGLCLVLISLLHERFYKI
ncbi:MAG: hypothetical protein QW374_00950 [Candidatus Bathyarchaeia archaeon]|nr:hypothetical protein [Candidatus Bathyarchaeota archaeon]